MGSGLRVGMTVFAFMMAGILIAAIIYELNSAGILIDEFITGSISITDLMTLVILVWTLIGGIVAVVRH